MLLSLTGLPTIGTAQQTSFADFAAVFHETLTSVPLIFAAAGTGTFAIELVAVPNISDTLDITYVLYVTNQTGTETALVQGGTSTPTPVDSFSVDLTGTSATIVGADLSWSNGIFTSAAGGVYTMLAYVSTGPD